MVNRNRGFNTERFNCPTCSGAQASKHNSCNAGDNYLLKKLQIVDFSLVDIVLYLDAYPNCQKALCHYHKLLEERAAILAKLDEAGIPITCMGNRSDSWKWTDAPWPWEYDANI